ncbi:MAG: hypothetical protein KZQ87_05030 [Candidatus Thiodiazotropha sp. (ex Cardiolucina cf. quadrata)]|nr:hypothetical protein [Candidatus Thiodiazotropha sp. (ex Cardiolucina cf. quadrata)]
MKSLNANILLLLFVLPMLFSCDDSSTSDAIDDTIAEQLIGVDGGSITSSDGRLSLHFPDGALPAENTITIKAVDPAQLGSEFDDIDVDVVYELGPDGLSFDEPVSVTLTMDAPGADDASGTTVTALPLLTASGGTVEAGGNPDIRLNDDGTLTATAEITHFSRLAHAESIGGSTVRAFSSGPHNSTHVVGSSGSLVWVSMAATVALERIGGVNRLSNLGVNFGFEISSIGPILLWRSGDTEGSYLFAATRTQIKDDWSPDSFDTMRDESILNFMSPDILDPNPNTAANSGRTNFVPLVIEDYSYTYQCTGVGSGRIYEAITIDYDLSQLSGEQVLGYLFSNLSDSEENPSLLFQTTRHIECVDDSEDVSGCTDSSANNYNPAATVDDGSCTYDVVEPDAVTIDVSATSISAEHQVGVSECAQEVGTLTVTNTSSEALLMEHTFPGTALVVVSSSNNNPAYVEPGSSVSYTFYFVCEAPVNAASEFQLVVTPLDDDANPDTARAISLSIPVTVTVTGN